MVELLVTAEGRNEPLLTVRKHLDDHVRLAHQVRWLTRAQGAGVVRVHQVGPDAGHYCTHFGGPLTLAAATAPDTAAPILATVWATLERIHRLGLTHGAVTADHVVVGRRGSLLLSPGGPGVIDRRTDIAAFGRMVASLADVWSIESTTDSAVVSRWRAVGRQITELGGTSDRTDDDRLISGAEVRRLLTELGPPGRSGPRFVGPWLRRRRPYGPNPDRRAGRRRSRS